MSVTQEGICPACGEAMSAAARFCQFCGVPRGAPPTTPQPLPYASAREQGDATGGLIPYKNPAALIAYYCGVFAILPFFPIGLAGLILGIVGLKKHKQNPVISGRVHAWIGILAGGFFGLIWTAVTVLGIAASIAP